MEDLKYADAYSEVLSILQYISLEEYNKIPKSKLELFEKNYNKDHDFQYNPNKTLQEQNVSEIARTIIAILFRDYWATDEQKRKILLKENYDNDIEKEKIRQKFNTDNIFKRENRNKIIEKDDISDNLAIVEYKPSIFKKFIDKIKSIFYKN